MADLRGGKDVWQSNIQRRRQHSVNVWNNEPPQASATAAAGGGGRGEEGARPDEHLLKNIS